MTLRVVIADDSSFFRSVLKHLLELDGDIRVVGEAKDGAVAVKMVTQLVPDLVTIDIGMPSMGGLEAIEQIMSKRPVPILVVTGQPIGDGESLVYEAVRRGALEIVSKAVAGGNEGGGSLRALVRRLGIVRVVRHVKPLAATATAVAAPLAMSPIPIGSSRRPRRIVGVGASAGGPGAVVSVLGALPETFPACIALVQHLPDGFADSFAQYVRNNIRMKVEVVRERMEARPGVVLVAPDERHLFATPDGAFVPVDEGLVDGHRPSVTVMFRSIAHAHGAGAVGVILTGMGEDGTAGLLEMRGAQALTIAQDEETSAVYGMPKAAAEAGAAEHILPLQAIAPALIQAVGPG